MIHIITINKNNLGGLKRTVESILSQTDWNFKWTIIDGNSTDGSVEFIKKIEFDNLSVYIENDNGIYDAMNKGIVKTDDEDFVWFVNTGDSLTHVGVTKKIRKIDRDVDILYGNYNLLEVHNDKIEIKKKMKNPIDLNMFWLIKKNLNHQSYLIKGYLLKQFPFQIEYNICADWAQLLSIYCESNHLKIQYLSETLINYELGGFSSLDMNRYYNQKRDFLNSKFGENMLKDLEMGANVFSKINLSILSTLSKGRYTLVLFRFLVNILNLKKNGRRSNQKE